MRSTLKRLAAIENLGSMDETVIRLAALNSAFQTGLHSPMDEAILRHEHPVLAASKLIDEIPFDFSRRRLSVVVETGSRRLLVTKGAPESVLAVCAEVEVAGHRAPLDATARATADALFRRLSGDGYRVFAVAYREVKPQDVYAAVEEPAEPRSRARCRGVRRYRRAPAIHAAGGDDRGVPGRGGDREAPHGRHPSRRAG